MPAHFVLVLVCFSGQVRSLFNFRIGKWITCQKNVIPIGVPSFGTNYGIIDCIGMSRNLHRREVTSVSPSRNLEGRLGHEALESKHRITRLTPTPTPTPRDEAVLTVGTGSVSTSPFTMPDGTRLGHMRFWWIRRPRSRTFRAQHLNPWSLAWSSTFRGFSLTLAPPARFAQGIRSRVRCAGWPPTFHLARERRHRPWP